MFALLGGTGIGWVGSGSTEVQLTMPFAPGLAWARFAHLAPELGLFATPLVLISLQARLQFVTGTTDVRVTDRAACGEDLLCSAPRGSAAGFVKATLFGAPPARNLRPYVSLALGGGSIRYVVGTAGNPRICGPNANEPCFDTVSAGPVIGGPGVGLQYRVAGGFALVAAVELKIGAPRVAFNIDANVGAALGF
jgi:hypothetical protein